MNFVEELRWRGMLQDMMPGTEELLAKEQVTAYLGIDPTAAPQLLLPYHCLRLHQLGNPRLQTRLSV